MMIIAGLLTFNLIHYLIHSRVKGRFAMEETPMALQVLKGIYLLASALLLSELASAIKELQLLLDPKLPSQTFLLQSFSYFSIFLALVLAVLILLLWLSRILYLLFSKQNSPIQSAIHNDMGSVVLYAGILLSCTIVIKPAMVEIFELVMPVARFSPVLY